MEVVNLIWFGIFALVLVIVLTIAGVLLYSGLLTSFDVGAGPPPIQSLVLVYKFGKGPYRECGYVFNEAVSIAPEKKTIGFYYDDPKQVSPEQLRWAVGSIIAEGADFPDTQLIGKFMDKGFKVFHTPLVSNAVKAQFPYTTPLSIFIAIFRVYPAMAEYVKSKRLCAHPYVEIYDGNTIHFMAPLARQDDFYVREALDDQEEESTPEREVSVDPKVTTEFGQGDALAIRKNKPKQRKMSEKDNIASKTTTAETSAPEKKDEASEPQNMPGDNVPALPQSELQLPQGNKDRRSMSALSFRTATSEIIRGDDDGGYEEKRAVDEAVHRIKTHLDISTPEGMQDHGISSTSNGNHGNHPSCSASTFTNTFTTSIDTASTNSNSNSNFSRMDSSLSSSSNFNSFASSVDSVSSFNSSSSSSSFCSSNPRSCSSSYTSHSFTDDGDCSTYTEDEGSTKPEMAAVISSQNSMEFSRELHELSSDSGDASEQRCRSRSSSGSGRSQERAGVKSEV